MRALNFHRDFGVRWDVHALELKQESPHGHRALHLGRSFPDSLAAVRLERPSRGGGWFASDRRRRVHWRALVQGSRGQRILIHSPQRKGDQQSQQRSKDCCHNSDRRGPPSSFWDRHVHVIATNIKSRDRMTSLGPWRKTLYSAATTIVVR